MLDTIIKKEYALASKQASKFNPAIFQGCGMHSVLYTIKRRCYGFYNHWQRLFVYFASVINEDAIPLKYISV